MCNVLTSRVFNTSGLYRFISLFSNLYNHQSISNLRLITDLGIFCVCIIHFHRVSEPSASWPSKIKMPQSQRLGVSACSLDRISYTTTLGQRINYIQLTEDS